MANQTKEMSMETPTYTTKHGGKFKIEYEESTNVWRAEMEDEYVVASSLRELKEKLDRKTSPKAKSRKVPCLVKESYQGTLSFAHATSVDDHDYYIRVTRTKVYTDNEKNRELMAEIATVHAELMTLNTKMNILHNKLVPFDIAQLKDE
jgi:hypothetical protein